MVAEKKVLQDFFNDISKDNPKEFSVLLKEHKINYTTLIPFAFWSKEKYTRISLNRNENCELIILCWMPGQETKIHDHNDQNCQVYFAKGDFEECIYSVKDTSTCLETKQVKEGSITKLEHPDHLHSLRNSSSELAITFHIYTNPIDKCKVYSEGNELEEEVDMRFDSVIRNGDSTELIYELEQFLEISKDLIEDEITNPISERIPVEELDDRINFRLKEEAIQNEDFYKILKEVVLATPKTSSKLFFNQLFGGRQGKAILGDLLAVMLNNSMYTYKVAGIQVGIEKEILNQVISRIGYGSKADGTFPTGGSMSNFMAVLMARDSADKVSRHKGISQKLMAYTSKESHYSIEKNAAFIGFGRDNVRQIESDELGQMRADKLEEAIKADLDRGFLPFFINATAGTTVLGAFDPFEDISLIAKKYKVWMHIDGAYGGAVLFSEKYKHLIKGVENSDSFSFNPHKMLNTPMTCSIIVVNDKKHLYNSFSNSADYLYQTDRDDYNLGKTSFQCGRRNDSLKFWTLWKSIGSQGLEKIIDQQFYLADIARKYVSEHSDYELYSFEKSISVCFNYKGIPANELCTSLYEENELMVGYGNFDGIEFVRLVTINSSNSADNILNFFKILEQNN